MIYVDPRYELAKYLNVRKNWRKLKPHFESETFRRMWRDRVPNWLHNNGGPGGGEIKDYVPQPVPAEWIVPQQVRNWYWCERHTPGPLPAYWPYMWLGGCHWLVDAYTYAVRQAFPEEPWVIAKSNKHACVWNGDYGDHPLVFDPLYQAHGSAASKALSDAWRNGSTFRNYSNFYNWLPGAPHQRRKKAT